MVHNFWMSGCLDFDSPWFSFRNFEIATFLYFDVLHLDVLVLREFVISAPLDFRDFGASRFLAL